MLEEEQVETPDEDVLDERVHPLLRVHSHWEKSTNRELRYSGAAVVLMYRDRLK